MPTMTRAERIAARIKQIIQQGANDGTLEHLSSISHPDPLGIDDGGEYDDPTKDTTPDFLKKEHDRWD